MTSRPPRMETRLRSFFGLKDLPFAKDGDGHRFFETEAFLQAKDRLRYLVDRREIGMIFGLRAPASPPCCVPSSTGRAAPATPWPTSPTPPARCSTSTARPPGASSSSRGSARPMWWRI